MKRNTRAFTSLLLAAALLLTACPAALAADGDPIAVSPAAVSVSEDPAEAAVKAPNVKTDGAILTDGGYPDATFTDATATDATSTDATPTDAASAAAAAENGYTFIVSNGQAVIIAVDETIRGEVVIPDTLGGAPVGIVGVGAFKGKPITSVTLPDSVTAVDEQAFADCDGLDRIECGKSLRTLPESAYAGCSRLNKQILFAKDSAFFPTDNNGGAIYDRDKTELILVADSFTGAFTVPASVKYVRAGAFKNCASLTEVSFANPETAIGSYAFAGCTALEKATLPEKLTEISEGTFFGCSSLKNFDMIPGGLTAIGDGAFEDCAALTEFVVPMNCLRLGGGIFTGCGALKKAAVFAPVTALPDGLFQWCAALTEVQIPETVEAVGDRTFYGCVSLENVGDVLRYKHVGMQAFTSTAWYEKQVDGLFFAGETLLFCKGPADKTVDLSKTKITAIAPGAFDGNGTLEKVILPDSVAEIGACAFAGCSKLASVECNGTARIGADAFAGTAFAAAADGAELYLGDNLLLAAADATATDATATDATATDAASDGKVYRVRPGTKSIASGAFRALPELKEIVLPDGIEILSDGAFAGLDALEKVNIPDSVRYGDNAFDGIVPACAHPDAVVRYADTAVCAKTYFSGCTYCADCAALLDPGALRPAAGHRYQFVKEEPDPGVKEVVVIVSCAVCGDQKRIPLSQYKVTFADGEKAFADGAYLVIEQGVTAAELLAGCPADSLVLTAAGDAVPADQAAGSGMTVLFPSSRQYTVILFGDADGDGKITPADARFTLRLSVSLEEHIDWRDKACHVVYNGKTAVTSEDARLILRASVGLENASTFGRAPVPATPTDATPTDATPTDATPTDATPTDATPTDAPPADKPTEPEKPQPEKTYLPGDYVCIAEGGVYLRAYHGYDYSPMDIIKYKETVTVKDVYRDGSGKEPVWWGRITHNGVTGWSVLEYFDAK